MMLHCHMDVAPSPTRDSSVRLNHIAALSLLPLAEQVRLVAVCSTRNGVPMDIAMLHVADAVAADAIAAAKSLHLLLLVVVVLTVVVLGVV